MQSIAENLRLQHQYIGVVMTMGALHQGHLQLLELARKKAGTVILTIFVNPKQFGPEEDFHRYPRPFDQDAALAKAAEVDYLFSPPVELMFPERYGTLIDPGPLGELFEGRSRPGHFSGVATVVTKLLNITKPHMAIFGEKDAQQLAIIRKTTADLNIDTNIVGAPIVREEDGLATSSRNIYLSLDQRKNATALYRGISHARTLLEEGQTDLQAIALEVEELIASTPETTVDYACFVDNETFENAVSVVTGKAYRLILAATVGNTRLIDNWQYDAP
jgi:pantoate--beta-alanine ligase